METELYVAAVRGNVPSLRDLLAREERLLDSLMNGNRTPLHIAAMFGHVDFVLEVLARKPELASKPDSQGLTPLHLAAMKGHVDALEILVRERSDAARDRVKHGQTILHLCVTHDRLEALKLLFDILGDDLFYNWNDDHDNKFINWKDEDGNTILHLAAAYGQTKTMLFLTNKGCDQTIENTEGFTALDLSRDEQEIKRKRQDNMHNMLMVVAILVAAIAFEVGRDTESFKGRSGEHMNVTATYMNVTASQNVTAYMNVTASQNVTAPANSGGHPTEYKEFVACNTISFIASLSVIMLLISDVPLGRRIPTWIPMMTMWVAINFAAATYVIVIQVSCPEGGEEHAVHAIDTAVLVWVGLMALIFLYHVVHLIRKPLKKRKLEALKPKWLRIVARVFVPEEHCAMRP